MGPFTEASNSPILSTDAARDIISPGHHAIFRSGGRPISSITARPCRGMAAA
jgi:hypothetical protein